MVYHFYAFSLSLTLNRFRHRQFGPISNEMLWPHLNMITTERLQYQKDEKKKNKTSWEKK